MVELAESLVRLVRLMVDQPDEVSVDEDYQDGRVYLTLNVAERDVGKVIGRQGRTIRALRTLVAARNQRDGESYELDLAED